MDMTDLLQPSTSYISQPEVTKNIPTSVMMNQSCNIPDSTTESPTTAQVDSLLLQNPNDLQQLSLCQTNQLISQVKDSTGIDSDCLEEFRNIISDVSVPVLVDSTQPTNTVVDFPQFVDTERIEPVNNFQQYVANNQSNQQQVTQNTISQIIQPEMFKDQQKIPQHLLGQIDSCISNIIPDFSNYPANCTCSYIDKIVAVEQIWVCDKQMYFLPQIGIVVMGNREYSGIFHDQKKGYIPLEEVIKKMMPQYENDIISFLQRAGDEDQYTLTPQEEGYLEQRECVSPGCKYKCAISLSMLRQMAQFIVMYEGDKHGFDDHIRNVANGVFYRKIFQRHVRCGSCGGVILYSKEQEEYVLLKTEENEGKKHAKCFSVGFIYVGGLKFVAFKTDNRLYISVKELCQKQILRLQVLQARLGALRQRPRLAPSVLNNYLNTPEYDVKNTMWIDMATLRCICCMAKCSVGCNAEVYGNFARVIFKEHIVTNIFGEDDHESESAVYTMDPKTFEVVMKKTSMKPKQQGPPKTTDKPKPKTNLKSFELSSKQALGYESPEKLNESAFMYEKSYEEDLPGQNTSFIRKSRPKSSSKNVPKIKKTNDDEETFIFEDKASAIDFLTKGKFEKKEETKPVVEEKNTKKKKKKEEKYIPGKKPTFRVRPAEKPYNFMYQDKKEDNSKKKQPDLGKIQIKMENNKYVLTLSNKSKGTEKEEQKSNSNTMAEKKSNKNSKSKQSKVHDLKEQKSESNGPVNQDGDEARNAVENLVEEFIQQNSVVPDNCELVTAIESQSMDVCGKDTCSVENLEPTTPISKHTTDNFDLRTSVSNHFITPRTECRILSGIDLDGSISNVFDTPTKGNVVVEMMDNNETTPFADSTSPLSQLYHQYEQFERFDSEQRETTPDNVRTAENQTIRHPSPNVETVSESQFLKVRTGTLEDQENNAFVKTSSDGMNELKTNVQIHNEIPMNTFSGDKSVQDEKFLETTSLTEPKCSESQGNDQIFLEKNIQQNENNSLTNFYTSPLKQSSLKFKVCSEENIVHSYLNNTENTYNHSEERQKRSKTLSPPKNRNPAPNSPFISKNIKALSLSSPVFKKSGEIDRSHAKVQKLTELEDKSQPLDLLATLAQVITDESESQGCDASPVDFVESQSVKDDMIGKDYVRVDSELLDDKKPMETCAISDENSNVDKILFDRNCENVLNSVDQTCDNGKILQLINEVQHCLSIQPFKDLKTGHWKVKIQLKSNAKKAFPDLFSDHADKKKKNMFLALLGKLHLTELWNSASFMNSSQESKNQDKKTSRHQKSGPKSLKKTKQSSKKSSSLKSGKKTSHKKSKKTEVNNFINTNIIIDRNKTSEDLLQKSRKRSHDFSPDQTKKKKRTSR